MAVFAYKAFGGSTSGRVSGTVAADTPRQARDLLRERGLSVEQITPVKAGTLSKTGGSGRDGSSRPGPEEPSSSRPSGGFFFSGHRRDRAKVSSLARELSTLLAVGTPLTEALETIASQHRGSFRSCVLLLKEQVIGGGSLAEAMASQPAVFDELCVNLVETGEDSGMLDDALERYARFAERSAQFKGKLGTALLYPCIVLITAVGVSLFLMTRVVPLILQPLLDQGRPLPLPTRLVKGASDALLDWGWLAALLGLFIAAGWVMALRTKRGKWMWHSTLLRLPMIGGLLRKAAVVRIAIVVATLMESGVVFVRALEVARKGTRNVVLRDALDRCEAAVQAGGEIAPALAGTAAFAPLVVQVFSVGQQSGRLEEMLHRLAKDYDEQVNSAAQRFTAILEPVLILLLASLVLTIALATMLPILEAGDVLQ